MPTTNEDIEDPKVFCHLAGHPPLEGETLRQYLERVTPLLGKPPEVITSTNPEKATTPLWVWLILGAMAWLFIAAMLYPLFD